VTVGFAIYPFANILVSILVPERALAVRLISVPLALVLITIFKYFGSLPPSLPLNIYIPSVYALGILRQSYFNDLLEPLVDNHSLQFENISICFFKTASISLNCSGPSTSIISSVLLVVIIFFIEAISKSLCSLLHLSRFLKCFINLLLND